MKKYSIVPILAFIVFIASSALAQPANTSAHLSIQSTSDKPGQVLNNNSKASEASQKPEAGQKEAGQ